MDREDREALVRISKLGRNVEMYSRTLSQSQVPGAYM